MMKAVKFKHMCNFRNPVSIYSLPWHLFFTLNCYAQFITFRVDLVEHEPPSMNLYWYTACGYEIKSTTPLLTRTLLTILHSNTPQSVGSSSKCRRRVYSHYTAHSAFKTLANWQTYITNWQSISWQLRQYSKGFTVTFNWRKIRNIRQWVLNNIYLSIIYCFRSLSLPCVYMFWSRAAFDISR